MREPMCPRTDTDVDRSAVAVHNLANLAFLVLIIAILAGAFYVFASLYRQAHCIELFGHWIAVDRPSNFLCIGLQ